MPIASETELIAPGLWIWRFYDRAVKADLFSTGIAAGGRTYLIDPIRPALGAVTDLNARNAIAGIVVTNENHERAAGIFAEQFQIPIHLHPVLLGAMALPRTEPVQDCGVFAPGLTAIAIEGGPAGEIAVHCDADGGTMIMGDALINFEPYGFTLLPAKYCSNAKLMRRSLPKLLDYSFDRMLFAHGTPIVSGARQRLEELLRQA